MTLRKAAAGDLDALLEPAVAFYDEDGFTTPRSALAAHLRVLLEAKALIEDSAAWAASIGAAELQIVIAPNGMDVSHLFRYHAANGFTDEGRRLLSRPL
jgi:hypothetical protein